MKIISKIAKVWRGQAANHHSTGAEPPFLSPALFTTTREATPIPILMYHKIGPLAYSPLLGRDQRFPSPDASPENSWLLRNHPAGTDGRAPQSLILACEAVHDHF